MRPSKNERHNIFLAGLVTGFCLAGLALVLLLIYEGNFLPSGKP
jgi:hypothetical protein